MEISVFMKVTITCKASGVNSGELLLLVTGIFSAYLLLVFKNPTESPRSSTLKFDCLLQKNKIGCCLVEYEQWSFACLGRFARRTKKKRETARSLVFFWCRLK